MSMWCWMCDSLHLVLLTNWPYAQTRRTDLRVRVPPNTKSTVSNKQKRTTFWRSRASRKGWKRRGHTLSDCNCYFFRVGLFVSGSVSDQVGMFWMDCHTLSQLTHQVSHTMQTFSEENKCCTNWLQQVFKCSNKLLNTCIFCLIAIF